MKRIAKLVVLVFVITSASQSVVAQSKKDKKVAEKSQKKVVYQVFTRLFGNLNQTNKPWGTKEENGVGKFADFTEVALDEIKKLGVTHIWYTGVPHHALVGDYTKYGISNDDPDVVKGRAGSPYAVKDYYNVNPDLAVDPANRLAEFEALIDRTHKAGLKLLIDIVPNHVARRYQGKTNPPGVRDFGADDDTSVEYARDNNFYYIPNSSFKVPYSADYKPLGGNPAPGADGYFEEIPAKWTGNGSRLAQPDINDWYETVKINYGIRPDGTKDFPELPAGYDEKDFKAHFNFWKDKSVPSSWIKFKDIALYWIAKGVDGFRFDMAEMVPYEFWSYMNSSIKMKNPDAFLLAEVYNPNEYRNYIKLGKMDYLYDKVDLYDKLKEVVQGKSLPDPITDIQNRFQDIEHHLLHFLDNHDEQRLASDAFAGTAEKGMPLMVLSATISSSPTMIYFGQEVGERGDLDSGFGKPTRTTIFDYASVPAHWRWMNYGRFDGGELKENEKKLRDFYKRLLNFTLESEALMGNFTELQTENRKQGESYKPGLYSFARYSKNQKLIVVNNFSWVSEADFTLQVPESLIKTWKLKNGSYPLTEKLYGNSNSTLVVKDGKGTIALKLAPLESVILEVGK